MGRLNMPGVGGSQRRNGPRIAYTKAPAYQQVKEPLYRLTQVPAISPGAARQRKHREEAAKKGLRQCCIQTRIEAHQPLKEISKEIESGDSKHIAEVLRQQASKLDPDANIDQLAEIGAKVMARIKRPVIGLLLKKLLAL